MKQTLVISCPATSRSGYGDHARDLIRSLIAMDRFDIKILDQRWGICPRDVKLESALSDILLPVGTPLETRPDIWIQVTVPNEFQPIGTRCNIGITAGIETDRIEHTWIEGCNRMDMIIVPSMHSKQTIEMSEYHAKDNTGKIIKTAKVEKPVHVLFEGLNTDIFDKTEKAQLPISIVETLDEIKEEFCFLTVGHWLQGAPGHDRKDIGSTIHTFIETFKNIQQKPALILKTSSATFSVSDREDMLKRINSIKQNISVDFSKLPNIYLLHGSLTDTEMNGLYNHPKVKAMVSFTHGEGFGRPLLEFSVTGKPTIASNWSGHTDFMGNFTFKLPGQLKEIHESTIQENIMTKGAKWFYVDYGYASKLMKEVFRKYKQYLATSRKQRKFVKDNFTIEVMNNEFTTLINDNVPKPVELNLPKLKLPKLEKTDG